MGKRDQQLRKQKERERKVARKKVQLRADRQAAEKKARLEEIQALLDENPYPEKEIEDLLEELEESPYAMERLLRYRWKAALQAGLDPDNLTDELTDTLLDDFEAKRTRMLRENPIEEAHDLMLQALEEEDNAEFDDWKTTLKVQAGLVEEALALDPDNIDALVIRGNQSFNVDGGKNEEGLAMLREAVRKARSALGPEFFEKHRHRIGERIEARPFLRALDSLAMHLDVEGQLEEALPVLREAVEISHEGRSFLRCRLLDACLLLNQNEEARAVTMHSDFADTPIEPWAKALLEFQAGNREAADLSLESALKDCPTFPHLLAAEEQKDNLDLKFTHDQIRLGFSVLNALGRAWKHATEARAWLRTTVENQPPR